MECFEQGNACKSKIMWVKWDDVCKAKMARGLGVKDLRCVNMAFLKRWKLNILLDLSLLWVDFSKVRYDP